MAAENNERYLRGKEVLARVEQNPHGSILDSLASFSPDLERVVGMRMFLIGKVYPISPASSSPYLLWPHLGMQLRSWNSTLMVPSMWAVLLSRLSRLLSM